MQIRIKVVPGAKKEKIIKEKDFIKVYVKEPAQRNKANKRLVELLSEYFGVKKTSVKILKGKFGREKLVLIENSN